jgi:hypothetical protein
MFYLAFIMDNSLGKLLYSSTNVLVAGGVYGEFAIWLV